jgi:hypothetical protein
LEAPDWVTVVAVTADNRIVMVEQFRFGVGVLTTEPVAGTVDPGEDSLEAIASGQLRHLLGLSALSRVFPLWDLPYFPPTS